MIHASDIGRRLLAACTVPLGRTASEILVGLYLNPEYRFPEPADQLPFGVQVMLKRVRHHGLVVSDRAILYMVSACDRVGTLVLLVAVCKALSLGRAGKPLDLDDIRSRMDFRMRPA